MSCDGGEHRAGPSRLCGSLRLVSKAFFASASVASGAEAVKSLDTQADLLSSPLIRPSPTVGGNGITRLGPYGECDQRYPRGEYLVGKGKEYWGPWEKDR